MWRGTQLLLWCWLQRNCFHFAQLQPPPVSWCDIFIWFLCFSFPGSKTMELNHLGSWGGANEREGCTHGEKERKRERWSPEKPPDGMSQAAAAWALPLDSRECQMSWQGGEDTTTASHILLARSSHRSGLQAHKQRAAQHQLNDALGLFPKIYYDKFFKHTEKVKNCYIDHKYSYWLNSITVNIFNMLLCLLYLCVSTYISIYLSVCTYLFYWTIWKYLTNIIALYS